MKLALAASALAAAGLAGCTTYYDPPPPSQPVAVAPAPVTPVTRVTPVAPATSIGSYRPGFGIIESISLVTLPASASAGGTLPPVASGPYRMTLRMDDGNIQTVIQDTRAFLVGDRIQIMSDGRLIRP